MSNLLKILNRSRYHILILILLVLIAYLKSLSATFISDDVDAIINNPHIGDFHWVFKNPRDILTPLLYFIAYKLFGFNPIAFRSFNILFHLGTVILLYLLLTRISGKIVGFIVACLFAVHPIFTESITWISGGHYVRYGFFYLLSFYLYVRYPKNWKMIVLSLIAYSLALESAAQAVSLPLVLLLFNFIQDKNNRNFRSIIPYFLMLIIYVLIYFSAISARTAYLSSIHYNYKAGFGFNSYLVPPVALITYLQLLFWPDKLTFYHYEAFSYLQVFHRSLAVILFLLITAIFYKKNKLIFFWLCFFLLNLALVLSPLQVASASIADRYVYIASVGIIAPVGYLLYFLKKKFGNMMWIIFLAILLLLTARTILRNEDYQTYEIFWTKALELAPNSFQAHSNVGKIYMARGDLEHAFVEFQQAIALVPDVAELHYNLGTVYYMANKYPEALKEYNETLRLDPTYGQVYQNMASIYYRQHDLKTSEQLANKAIQYMPTSIENVLNLGVIYLAEGRKQEAQHIFREVIRIDPTNEKAKLGLQESLK